MEQYTECVMQPALKRNISRMPSTKKNFRDLFVLQEKLAGYKDGLKAGTYTLNTSMTPDEMIQIMAASSEEDQDGEGS